MNISRRALFGGVAAFAFSSAMPSARAGRRFPMYLHKTLPAADWAEITFEATYRANHTNIASKNLVAA